MTPSHLRDYRRFMLKRTPFYDFHISVGAKMVEYAGWEMPLLYRGITEEHLHTRASGSIFDVSHMGRLRFSGKDAVAFLDRVLTRNVARQQFGQSRYSLVCNESGGVMDDVIVSRDESDWLVVCNAANRQKLIDHFSFILRHSGLTAFMDDTTEKTGMVAVQGPKVIERLSEVLPVNVSQMKRYTFESASAMFIKFTVFRSGYTGEDGVEIILPAKAAAMAMKFLGGSIAKKETTLRPAGLGARDTLRLEAAMPLFGHELDESTDPLTAGFEWAVDLQKDFIGANRLRQIAASGPSRKLIGLELDGRRIARQGTPILIGDKQIGQVTSGTFSPTLQKSIAMAYVETPSAASAEMEADIKGERIVAKVVALPFYKRN
ncbi:MAG TPA: glycine cleavage system aminomethyltransferase GcvT [Tepidisphaeraceae bacterium]|nr:glycine cleavage system aminomethyltransferase GcvT [Tepidisphaeraceae bacterium]